MKIKKIMSMMLLFCFSLFANEKLVLGVNPYKSTAELQEIYAELIAYLEKALDREIVFVVSKDYNQLLTLIEQGTRFSVQHTVLVEHKLFYRLAERAVLLTQSPIAWHTTPHAVLLNGADGI
jgi:hypothetical protein